MGLVEPGCLTLGCADIDAPPLFSRADAEGRREGYEPSAAALVASALGLEALRLSLDRVQAVEPGHTSPACVMGPSMTVAVTAVSSTAPASSHAAVPSTTFSARPPGGPVDGSVRRT